MSVGDRIAASAESPPMTITVVVPAFNAARYLPEALASVAGQTSLPDEVLVVDDGSTDDTAAVAAAFAKTSPFPIRVWSRENGGAAAARNAGIREASGSWIAFLDADDVYEPGAIATFRRVHEAFPDVRWIGGDFSVVSADLSTVTRTSMREGERTYRLFEQAFETGSPVRLKTPWQAALGVCFTLASAMTVRRDVLLGAGGFEESLPVDEDYQMWIRLARTCDFVFVPEHIYRYRRHGESLTRQERAPCLWRKRAFRQLAERFAFERDDPVLKRRLAEFELSDAAYFLKRGEMAQGLRCLAAAMRERPGAVTELPRLAKSVLG